MKKLSFAFVAVAVMMLSATAFGFADTAKEEIKPISAERVETIADTIVVEKGFVNKPKDFVLATVNDALVVSGTGRENDRVTITMYTRSGKEYVPMGEVVELKIGPLGVFTKELSLKEASTSSPKEAVVSKETFIVLELKRGEATTWDYRLIRFSDDKDVKKSLESLKAPMLSPAVK